MQVCYPNSTPSPPWQGNVPGCCGPVPDRWNKRLGDYLSNSLQQGAGGRQRLTPEQANCMVYGVAKHEQSPRGIVNTLADNADHQREFVRILKETEACCLDKSSCNRDGLDGRQPARERTQNRNGRAAVVPHHNRVDVRGWSMGAAMMGRHMRPHGTTRVKPHTAVCCP
jgi:hypothetical protein